MSTTRSLSAVVLALALAVGVMQAHVYLAKKAAGGPTWSVVLDSTFPICTECTDTAGNAGTCCDDTTDDDDKCGDTENVGDNEMIWFTEASGTWSCDDASFVNSTWGLATLKTSLGTADGAICVKFGGGAGFGEQGVAFRIADSTSSPGPFYVVRVNNGGQVNFRRCTSPTSCGSGNNIGDPFDTKYPNQNDMFVVAWSGSADMSLVVGWVEDGSTCPTAYDEASITAWADSGSLWIYDDSAAGSPITTGNYVGLFEADGTSSFPEVKMYKEVP